MNSNIINLRSREVNRMIAESLVILLSLLFPYALNGQNDNYQLYSCRGASYRTRTNGEWSEWTRQEGSLTMRNCINERRFEFNNNSNTVFYFTGVIEKDSGTDEDGDEYTVVRHRGYDQDGLQCHLVIIDWPDFTNRNYRLEYSDFEIIYYCNLIRRQSDDII